MCQQIGQIHCPHLIIRTNQVGHRSKKVLLQVVDRSHQQNNMTKRNIKIITIQMHNCFL